MIQLYIQFDTAVTNLKFRKEVSSMDKPMDDTTSQFLSLFTKNLTYGYVCIAQKKVTEKMIVDERDGLTQGKPYYITEDKLYSQFLRLHRDDSFSWKNLTTDEVGCYVNVFFSPFIYRKSHRIQDNTLFLSTLYVDLDQCTEEDALERLKMLPDELQYPTIIVNSGNGIHIYWILSYKPQVSEYLSLWKRTMNELCNRLDGDPRVNEHARLMRLPGSWNQKNEDKSLCRIVKCDPAAQFNLIPVAQHLETYSIRYKKRVPKQKREKNELKPKNYNHYNTIVQNEIITVIKERSQKRKDIGFRNMTLYILKQLGASEDRIDYVNNCIFSNPLAESELRSIKMKSELSPPLRASIVTNLQVTLEEQRGLRYLVNEELYKVRQSMKKFNERKFPSLMNRLLKLLKQKYAKNKQPLKTIALELGVSPKTASKYRKSRNTAEMIRQFDQAIGEIQLRVEMISHSLASLQNMGWTISDEDAFRKVQEVMKQFIKLYERSKIFRKKQLSTTEYRGLLKVIWSLEKVKKQFNSNQKHLTGGKNDE